MNALRRAVRRGADGDRADGGAMMRQPDDLDDMPFETGLEQCAAAIFKKYHDHYDGEIQGCCPLITDEIQRRYAHMGAVVVAGEITFYGGSVRRTHWWAEVCGITLDPMGDALMDPRDFPERIEIHRDRAIFDAILPDYERWRVPRS